MSYLKKAANTVSTAVNTAAARVANKVINAQEIQNAKKKEEEAKKRAKEAADRLAVLQAAAKKQQQKSSK